MARSRLGAQLAVHRGSRFRFSKLTALVESPADDSEAEETPKAPKASRRYAVHVNFGNEDVASWRRTSLVASKPFAEAMSFLMQKQMARQDFRAKELLAAAKWPQVCRLDTKIDQMMTLKYFKQCFSLLFSSKVLAFNFRARLLRVRSLSRPVDSCFHRPLKHIITYYNITH